MADDKTEAENIWRKYYGDPDGLAAHLIGICLSKLSVVYHVFAILDTNSDYDVSCRFWKKVDAATLQKLLETNEGIAFCKVIYAYIEAGPGGVSFMRSCSTTPGELIFFKSFIDSAKVKPNDTAQPRKLSDAEIAAYKEKAKKGEKFKEEVIWELPNGGTGFVVYNRDDVPKDGMDQIGTKETIEAIIHLSREWINYVPNKNKRLLQIGDISRPGGLDTSQHGGHEDGKIVDIRPLRNDGANSTLR